MKKTFEELIMWQEAERLVIAVYRVMKKQKDFGFRDQIQRAAISVTNNIAEGYERDSKKDMHRFFVIAKSSCAEVRSMSHVALALDYMNEDEYNMIVKQCFGMAKMIYKYMQKIET